jgi:hypothetical protein
VFLPQIEHKGWTFVYQTEGDWIGTLPTGLSIVVYCDVGICDRFPFMDLRHPEICGAFAHMEALQQIAVVDHAMMNMAHANNDSHEERYFGPGTDDNCFGHVNGINTDRYDTGTS